MKPNTQILEEKMWRAIEDKILSMRSGFVISIIYFVVDIYNIRFRYGE
jgi:hypothetical protein